MSTHQCENVIMKMHTRQCIDVLFDDSLSIPGVVPEPTSQVEKAKKVKLLVAFTLPPHAFSLPSTPWRHHLLLTLLGTQRLLRWGFPSLSSELEIGGNFLGLVMIPFKLLTAELSCDFSLPGAASPFDNGFRRSQ